MLLARTDTIAGIPATAARAVARVCAQGWHTYLEDIRRTLEQAGHDEDPQQVVTRFVKDGYLQLATGLPADYDLAWELTMKGNALAMARFGHPLKRAKADLLLQGLVARASVLNADPDGLFFVDRLRVFGSYLDTDRQELGDLDVELVLSRRVSAAALTAYGRSAQRSFANQTEQAFWAQTEFIRQLKNRSPYIQITLEDTDSYDAGARTVFERSPEESNPRRQ